MHQKVRTAANFCRGHEVPASEEEPRASETCALSAGTCLALRPLPPKEAGAASLHNARLHDIIMQCQIIMMPSAILPASRVGLKELGTYHLDADLLIGGDVCSCTPQQYESTSKKVSQHEHKRARVSKSE